MIFPGDPQYKKIEDEEIHCARQGCKNKAYKWDVPGSRGPVVASVVIRFCEEHAAEWDGLERIHDYDAYLKARHEE